MTAVSLETEKENQGQEKQAIPSPQKEGKYGGRGGISESCLVLSAIVLI